MSSPCPRCGYVENLNTKPLTNVMNTYVDDATGKPDGIYNETAEYITVKGKKLRRSDVKTAFTSPKEEVTPVPPTKK